MGRALTAFTPEELRALDWSVRVARDLTGQYFALPDDWFEAASHQVCTAKDLHRNEILEEGRLALIRRLYRLREGGGAVLRCENLCPHYRICLQDHNILGRLERDRRLELPELLTCVLTHEFVHLVRFCRLEHPYEAPDERRLAEEQRVDEITRRILSRLGYRRLRHTADRFAGASARG
jgi:hypothetical protein